MKTSIHRLLKNLPQFLQNNTSDKTILTKFFEMHHRELSSSIKPQYRCLRFLENIDNYTINYLNYEHYIGEDCIYNAIKEILRDPNSKKLDESEYIINLLTIHPDTSVEAVEENLWRLESVNKDHNVSYVVKTDSNFSILRAEILLIGIK